LLVRQQFSEAHEVKNCPVLHHPFALLPICYGTGGRALSGPTNDYPVQAAMACPGDLLAATSVTASKWQGMSTQ